MCGDFNIHSFMRAIRAFAHSQYDDIAVSHSCSRHHHHHGLLRHRRRRRRRCCRGGIIHLSPYMCMVSTICIMVGDDVVTFLFMCVCLFTINCCRHCCCCCCSFYLFNFDSEYTIKLSLIYLLHNCDSVAKERTHAYA